jgi:murein DD-endopeptidase MepM/ murein hydrolase activator NlpD
MKIFFFISFFFCCYSSSWAQSPENVKINDTKIIENPAKEVDTLQKKENDEKKANSDFTDPLELPDDSSKNLAEIYFNPNKTPSIVSEELYSIDVGQSDVVKVSQEINIGSKEDTAWIKIADYYAIWDNYFINPYNRDARYFNEVIPMKLYNPEIGQMWASPLESTFPTSGFGPRWGRYHYAIDLQLYMGDPVYSVFDGIVRVSGFEAGYGYHVVVRHYNGLETLYGHFSQLKVESGQFVKAGQVIGLGGSTGHSTGPHLHFEVRYQGNQINPTLLFDFSGGKPKLISQDFTLLPEHFNHFGNQVRVNIHHFVIFGETLESISKKYNVPVHQLADLNHLELTTELIVGQKLRIR